MVQELLHLLAHVSIQFLFLAYTLSIRSTFNSFSLFRVIQLSTHSSLETNVDAKVRHSFVSHQLAYFHTDRNPFIFRVKQRRSTSRDLSQKGKYEIIQSLFDLDLRVRVRLHRLSRYQKPEQNLSPAIRDQHRLQMQMSNRFLRGEISVSNTQYLLQTGKFLSKSSSIRKI